MTSNALQKVSTAFYNNRVDEGFQNDFEDNSLEVSDDASDLSDNFAWSVYSGLDRYIASLFIFISQKGFDPTYNRNLSFDTDTGYPFFGISALFFDHSKGYGAFNTRHFSTHLHF